MTDLSTQSHSPTKRGWYKRHEIALTPWLFLLPGFLFFAVYVIFPIAQSFNVSLYAWDGLDRPIYAAVEGAEITDAECTALGPRARGNPGCAETGEFASTAEYIGLENYQELLGDRNFEISLWNNLKWLVLYLLAIPMGLFIALFLNQTVFGIRLYKSLFFFPFVISQVVVGLVFSWFYLPDAGLLDSFLQWLGFDGLNVLGNPDYATYGIIAAGLWPQTAYCMILYLTGLNAVDPEQVEAARLDGAKGWKMLWYVIIPQLKPATFIAFVVTIIGALRSFDLISIMTNGGPFGSTRVLSFYMFEKALSEYGFRMGYGAAIAVVLFLIMLVFIAYFLWSMYRDERGY